MVDDAVSGLQAVGPESDRLVRRLRSPSPAVRAAVLLALLVAVFLGRPIVHGQWFIPADLTQVAGTRTDPRGAAVVLQNGLLTDPVSQMDPWFHYDTQEVHAGRLPTWNPYNGLGVPELANYQAAVFSPYTLPFYVLPLRVAFTVSAGLKLWTLAFFCYLFLRRWRIRHGAALLGAAVYGFGGYHLLWLDWQHVGAAICLPAGAWATMVVLQARSGRERRLGLAALSLALGSAVLAGHPETLYWSSLTLGIVILGSLLAVGSAWRTRAVRALQLLAAGVLGVALGAVQILPFQQYLKLSTEYAMRNGQGIPGGIGNVALPLLAFPDALGNPSLAYTEKVKLLGNYNELNGDYVGLIAMGLALLGLCALFRPGTRRRLTVIGAAVTALGYSLFHIAAVSNFTVHTPVLKLSTTNRSHDVWIFGVAVLAAVGMDLAIERFARHRTPSVARVTRGGVLALLGVAVVSAAGVALSLHGYARLRHLNRLLAGTMTDTAVARHTVHSHVEWVLGCTLVAVLAVGVLVLAPGPRRHGIGVVRSRWLPALVSLVVLAQFGITGAMLRNYNPSLPTARVYPLTADYRQAIAITGNDTSIKDSTTFALPDSNVWWRTPQLTSYDALGVRWYDELYERAFGEPVDTAFDEGTPACMATLHLFGVRWIWSKKAHPLMPGLTGFHSTNVVGPDVTGLRLTNVVGAIRLFQVPNSTGRFAVVPRSVIAPNEAAALDQVASCSFDADRTAVLLGSGLGSAPRSAATSSSATAASQPVEPPVTVLEETTERLRLQVPAGPGGELVLRQTWFPGWEATVDGRRTPIDRVDVAFRGVALTAGAHTVELDYRPARVRWGFVISATAALATGLLALPSIPTALWARRRRRQSDRPDDASTSSV